MVILGFYFAGSTEDHVSGLEMEDEEKRGIKDDSSGVGLIE